jgi:cytochrome c biogenesis protein
MVTMNGLKRLFLSRATILTLILLSVGALLVASLVPQAFLLSRDGLAKWHADYPQLAPFAERLGLTQLYSQPWFALLLALAVLSLLFSSAEQAKTAWRLTFGAASPAAGASGFRTQAPAGRVSRTLRSAWYLRVANGEVQRYLCHPWGLWGNCLLHAGMVIVIASSFGIAATQQRGMVKIVEGETFQPGQPWASSETGPLAKPLVLEGAVRLEKLSYDYWPGAGIKALNSTISFLHGDLPADERFVAINSILSYRGLRVYQGTDFGHAFNLELSDSSGKKQVMQLLMNHQESPEKASYDFFPDALGSGSVLRAKYFVDQEKRSLTRENPVLVLRVDQSGQELGQLPLKERASGSLGPYQFRLLKVARWSSLIFVQMIGMAGIFLGFAVIVLGGALNYFTAPREVTLREASGGGTLVTWRALRFSGFYQDEFDCLLQRLDGEPTRDE